MANYSLVANSVFQPFSYQELAAPLDRQEAYHEKLAEEYDKLSSQADILEVMGANDRDKKSGAYSKYKAYSDFLRSEADHLYQHGLDIDSRERLTDLRRRYNTDIIPIHNAWKKRETEAATQQQALLNNPHLMFTRDADKTSLDDYLTNPMGGYGVVNGATITAQMSQMAGTLAKKIRNGEKVDIDPYTYDYIRKYGLTEDLIRDWRNNPSLSKMFEQVMKANGVTPEALANSMNAQSIIDRSTNYAEMGMWNAIGEDKAQVLENFGSRLAAQEAKEKRVAAYQHALSNPNPIDPDNSLRGATIPFNFPDKEGAGKSARSELANLTANYVEDYLKNGAGKGKLNEGGIKKVVDYLRKTGETGINLSSDTMAKVAKLAPGLTSSLKNHLKNNFTGDASLVDMWLYHKPNTSAATTQTKAPKYSSSVAVPTRDMASMNEKGSAYQTSSWDDFDNMAHTGYRVNVKRTNLKPEQEKHIVEGILSRNMLNGNVNLYEAKSINSSGVWDYSKKKIQRSQLPQNSNGEIDYDKIHVTNTYNTNGDLLLWWDDGKDTKWALARLGDISSNLQDYYNSTVYPSIRWADTNKDNKSKATFINTWDNLLLESLGPVGIEEQKIGK